MVRVALRETRSQLGTIDERAPLYNQIKDIFLMFCGDYGGNDELIDLENLSVSESGNSRITGELPKKRKIPAFSNFETKRMELLQLPQFVNYFSVARSDARFFDRFIDRVSVLAEQEYYVDNGLTFKHLLVELHRYGFLVGCELTDQEPNAVMNSNLMLHILHKIKLIDDLELQYSS